MEKLFISYSHKDEEWKNRLMVQLGVPESEGYCKTWDDRQIQPGDDWLREIQTALNQVSVAIMLISASFLTSPFIKSNEVPVILQRRERDGLWVIPLLIGPCDWEAVGWLSKMQMLPGDGKSLLGLSHYEAETCLAGLAKKIRTRLETVPSPVPPKVTQADFLDESIFVGREAHLERMGQVLRAGVGSAQVITGRLFSIAGAGGVGKTMLANEAAKRYGSHFPDGVYIIRVAELTPIAFAVHLAFRLGQKIPEPPNGSAARAAVSGLLKNRRLLLVLDNAEEWKDLKFMLPCETDSAILVTTRNRECYHHVRLECGGLRVSQMDLETFHPDEVLALFAAVLGDAYRESEEGVYLEVSENLGHLPLALRQAAALMVFRPRYTASQLLAKLAGDGRLDVLRKGAAVEDSNSRALEVVFDLSSPHLEAAWVEGLQTLAVCAPGAVPLDFLEKLSGNNDMVEILEALYSHSWCNRTVEGESRFYELHPLVRDLVKGRYGDPFGANFIGLVDEIFTDKEVHFTIKDRYFPQLEEAFLVAERERDERLKKWIGKTLFYFCTYRGYGDFYVRLTEGVEVLFPDDLWTLRSAYGHRALILSDRGQLEEALALLKKQETICNQLGDRAGGALGAPCSSSHALAAGQYVCPESARNSQMLVSGTFAVRPNLLPQQRVRYLFGR